MNKSFRNLLTNAAQRAARRETSAGALILLHNAWKVAESTGEDVVQADVAYRLATVYWDLGDSGKAEEFARLAIKFETRIGRHRVLGNRLMFLANVLATSGRLEQALVCAEYGLDCYQHADGGDLRAPMLRH